MPVVPKDVFEKILKELENPSPPNQDLIAAFKKYDEGASVEDELVYTHKQMIEVMNRCLECNRALERRDKAFAAEAAEYNAEIQKAVEGIKIFYRESRTITPKMQDVIDDFCPELNE